MSLGLITGRAGSGKTEACIRQIRERLAAGKEEEYILLTPEQATFANEKRLLTALGSAGGFRVKVLSFRRFVHWVLQETGGGLLPSLDKVGKSLILRRILEEKKRELKTFQRVWDKKGFVRQMADLMEELRTYRVSPAALVSGVGEGSRAVFAGGKEPGGNSAAGGGTENGASAGREGEALSFGGGGNGGEGESSDAGGGDGSGGNAGGGEPEEAVISRLRDIQRIYAAYGDFLAGQWLDFAGELSLLCEKLPHWPRLSRISFWLDGFHGFTPAEFQVIARLLAEGRQLKVTLNLPEGYERKELAEEDLFYPAWETATELRRICFKSGFAMEETLSLPEPGKRRFAASPGLARLEAGYAAMINGAEAGTGADAEAAAGKGGAGGSSGGGGRGGGETGGSSGGGGNPAIRLVSCGDMRQETERLAAEILEAARDGGMRYKDMAVLLRQPEAYESLFHSIFPAYGIPYFFDGPKSLRYHPLVSLVRELTVFLKDRWNTGTLTGYMKTGLTGLTDNQSAALENYCLAYGIRRKHWESRHPWRFGVAGEAEREKTGAYDAYIEGLRQKLWQPLRRLRERIEGANTAEDMTAAVYQHLVELKTERALNRLANEALERGEPESAQIHQRTWQKLMELFDQTVMFLGENPEQTEPAEELAGEKEAAACPAGAPVGEKEAAAEEDAAAGEKDVSAGDGGKPLRPDPRLLAAVWESGLEAMEMAALPPALDQVTLCSMDRSRSPLAAKVWILGANDGVLPARIREDSLLGAGERQWLARRQVYLAPDSRRRIFSETYLIYIALTRASKSLTVSCARADVQGKSQTPSPLLGQLCRLFPGLAVDAGEPEITLQLARPSVSMQLLGPALRKAEDAGGAEVPAPDREGLWRYVLRWFADRPEYSRDMERLKTAYGLPPLGQPLPEALAERLFGRIIKTSVTRLEQYQACPFAHFLAFGLALEPRAEYEVRPPEIGNFFHDSLEALAAEVKGRGLALGDLSRQELESLTEKTAREQLARKNHEIFLTSAWYRSLSDNLSRILQSSARALAYQESQGVFRPYALEAAFGFDGPESLPPVALELGGGRRILLRGRIDRIDVALHPSSGQRFLRVVDYKSGHKTLALHEVYHGLKLQLVLYMEAALAAMPGVKPAGLFYFQVSDPVLRAANAAEAGDEEWRRRETLKAQAFRGYLLRDREAAALMDRDYGHSLFLPVSELKTGEFSKNSKLLSGKGFRLLGEHSRRLLSRAGEKIMAGDIALNPYQSGKMTACLYCPYGSVCRFDPAVPGHSYRSLPALKDETVLERLGEGEETP